MNDIIPTYIVQRFEAPLVGAGIMQEKDIRKNRTTLYDLIKP